jgi:tetratricopeptide (TPR) repeat protein
MAQELQLSQVFTAIEQALHDKEFGRVQALVGPAVEQFPEISQLWFYLGCFFYKTGSPAVASVLFNRAIDLDDLGMVYSNLGACLRRMNLHEEGLRALEIAIEKDPNAGEALVNLGAMYVNEGCPELGIPYLEKARALGHDAGKQEHGTIWNLGLLYLESGRFAEGFDCYRTGVVAQREARMFGNEKLEIPEPKWLAPEDERKGKTLIVYGEQGLGDELMYGTMLKDAQADFREVIFECHPRLEPLHRRAHPSMRIFPTRKEEYIRWPESEKIHADYKCPIGDLGAIYRRSTADFLKPHDLHLYRGKRADWSEYRDALELLAEGRPIVGLATRGGVMQTSRTYRTIRAPEVDRLMSETQALFVALDYDDITDLATYATDKFGEHRFRWWPSIAQHFDYYHLANLIQATDLTVTVCQSAFHLSAGLGHPTRCLVPKRCAWRYAAPPEISRDISYWWPHPKVKLYRQEKSDSWDGALDRVIDDINAIAGKR